MRTPPSPERMLRFWRTQRSVTSSDALSVSKKTDRGDERPHGLRGLREAREEGHVPSRRREHGGDRHGHAEGDGDGVRGPAGGAAGGAADGPGGGVLAVAVRRRVLPVRDTVPGGRHLHGDAQVLRPRLQRPGNRLLPQPRLHPHRRRPRPRLLPRGQRPCLRHHVT
ncbi:uncharacterized protein LOC102711767 isoform X1 [Oryza brachyantha]|uniref:uncharacterized protein LOC102711767 isoform X1 n=1 Tax=Oryza brachyantha TaxID=4533 RepID=UPI001ADBF1BE|nr:uncharacterized protein LOC102711767 isoform X1 [Oryza brachyantha]